MTFTEEVYEQLKKVPRGKVTTYKQLANKLGSKAYRAVGRAMKNNPYAPEVPCHRVVRSDGSVGGFMGKTSGKEIARKIALLKGEGVEVNFGKVVDFNEKLFLD